MSVGRPPRGVLIDGGEASVPTQVVRLSRVDAQADLERTLVSLLPHVRRLLFRMLGPQPALEDAVQDALIELARALPQFEGRSSLEAFARTVAARVAYRYYRRTGPSVSFDPELCAALSEPADEELERRHALVRLHRCLARLPAKRRSAFVLIAIEGLTPQEAAQVVGSSAGAMRSRYMHARDELQRMLRSKEGGRE